MGLFKSEGSRPAVAKIQRAGVATKSGVRHVGMFLARLYFASTPVGKAVAALERGDARFEIELTVTDRTRQTVNEIEAVGWQLEDTAYERVEVRTVTNNPDGSSSTSSESTQIGIYQFRRAE